jgi:hypothetical protein
LNKKPALDELDLKKLRDEQVAGLEVKSGTISDWLKAMKAQNGTPSRVRGEKVVDLKAAPSSKWGVL